MKIKPLCFLCMLFLALSHITLASYPPPTPQYFDQSIDHFSNNTDSFVQTYLLNDTFWNPENGPIFLIVGGEYSAETWWGIMTGELVLLAMKYDALLLVLEHRFYGTSVPYGNWETQNMLQHLTIEQALADIAEFRAYIVELLHVDEDRNKWIVFGCSYSGVMASYFKTAYPDLSLGAIVSSAPVQPMADFQQFFHLVATGLSVPLIGGSDSCVKGVQTAFQTMDQLILNGTGQEVEERMSLCYNPSTLTRLDNVALMSGITVNFIGPMIQYEKYWTHDPTITVFCDYMSSDTPFENFATMFTYLFVTTQGLPCYNNTFSSSWGAFMNASENAGEGRAYLFTSCLQLGWFHTCEPTNGCIFSQFGNIQDYYTICQLLFNLSSDQIESGIGSTLKDYGGMTPKGSNITFVNGSFDPWHSLSVTEDIPAQGIEAIYINGTSHCSDTNAPTSNDPSSLVEARDEITIAIQKLLQS